MAMVAESVQDYGRYRATTAESVRDYDRYLATTAELVSAYSSYTATATESVSAYSSYVATTPESVQDYGRFRSTIFKLASILRILLRVPGASLPSVAFHFRYFPLPIYLRVGRMWPPGCRIKKNSPQTK